MLFPFQDCTARTIYPEYYREPTYYLLICHLHKVTIPYLLSGIPFMTSLLLLWHDLDSGIADWLSLDL